VRDAERGVIGCTLLTQGATYLGPFRRFPAPVWRRVSLPGSLLVCPVAKHSCGVPATFGLPGLPFAFSGVLPAWPAFLFLLLLLTAVGGRAFWRAVSFGFVYSFGGGSTVAVFARFSVLCFCGLVCSVFALSPFAGWAFPLGFVGRRGVLPVLPWFARWRARPCCGAPATLGLPRLPLAFWSLLPGRSSLFPFFFLFLFAFFGGWAGLLAGSLVRVRFLLWGGPVAAGFRSVYLFPVSGGLALTVLALSPSWGPGLLAGSFVWVRFLLWRGLTAAGFRSVYRVSATGGLVFTVAALSPSFWVVFFRWFLLGGGAPCLCYLGLPGGERDLAVGLPPP